MWVVSNYIKKIIMNKKLIWFRSELVLSHLTQSDSNKWYDWVLGEEIVSDNERPSSLDWHIAMKRAIKIISTPIDGTLLSRQYGDGLNLHRLPHNNGILLYNIDNGQLIDRNFADLIERQVALAIDHAEKKQIETIYLSYSGGSDSSLLVAAFMQNSKSQKWLRENKIKILTSRFAQREDPELWCKLRNLQIPFKSIDYDSLIKDTDNWMIISGEGEPYGTFFINQTKGILPPDQQLSTSWKILEKLFITREPSGLAWSYFVHLMRLAPFDVQTLHQAWWWYENCVDRQDDMFRYNAFSSNKEIRTDAIGHGNRCFYFFNGQDFIDHAAYLILENQLPHHRDFIKFRSDEYTSRWLGYSEIKIKPKFYSMDKIPRHNYKLRIFDDFSWDTKPTLDGYF